MLQCNDGTDQEPSAVPLSINIEVAGNDGDQHAAETGDCQLP